MRPEPKEDNASTPYVSSNSQIRCGIKHVGTITKQLAEAGLRFNCTIGEHGNCVFYIS